MNEPTHAAHARTHGRGDIVDYYESAGSDPQVAIVVKTLDDGVVNLITFDGLGVSQPRLAVPTGDPGNAGRWAKLGTPIKKKP